MLQQPDPVDFAGMFTASTSFQVLARLRRSTRIAAFMVLVMVLKLSGGFACLGESPENTDSYAERQALQATAGTTKAVMTAAVAQDDQVAGHAAGTCCHCSCHQATTLQDEMAFQPAHLSKSLPPGGAEIAFSARIERELRPPIA